MSENKETLMPSAPKDNSIVSRKKYVKESLDLIKEKKDRLRQTMKAISESEQPDLEVMGKLLQAYDTMTEQENQYLEVLKSIVIIHEHAVEDVAQDLAAAKAELAAQPNIKPPVASENPANEPASEEDMKELLDTLKEIHDVSKQAALAAQINEQLQDKLNLHKNKKAALQEIRKEKAEALQKKANETLTAVEMTKIKLDNEKQAKKQKEKELERLRKTALQKGIELGVVEENMKDAAIKAISDLTSDAQRIPPTMGETEEEREEKPSLTKEEQMEERRKEIRENIKKERERKELVNQQIREKLKAVEARKDRIRQLREMLEISHKHALAEQAEQDAQQQAQEHAEQQNEKPAEEQVKQQAEKKTSNDLEKDDHKEEELHSLDRQISSDIHDDMTEEELREYERTEKELSETIRNATFNLQNLTLMRMRLEDMQARGESISEEDAQLIDRLDNHGGNEQSSEAIEDQAPPVPTSSPPSASLEKEIEDVVREQFTSVFKKPATSARSNVACCSCHENYNFSTTATRLNRMEHLFRQQMDDVRHIKEMICPTASNLSITKSALLRASSSLLGSLADVLSQMAVGQHTAARELDSLLNQLYQADYTVSNNSLHHQALNSDVHMGFEDVIANPQAYDYSEEISQHQNSKRDNQSPTLVKQKTIESVRFVIEPTEIEDNVEYRSPSTSEISGSSTSERLSCSPTAAGGFAHPIVGYQAASGGSGMTSTESVESNGIWMKQINSEADVVPVNNQTEVVNEPERENEISKTENEHLQNIVRTIIQILSSQFQCATVLTLDIGNSLRDLIVALARQHFQRVPTDLLHSQLGSVVLDVVNPYLDMPIQPNRKQFLRELSVILYNELSFFHILNSVQSIPD